MVEEYLEVLGVSVNFFISFAKAHISGNFIKFTIERSWLIFDLKLRFPWLRLVTGNYAIADLVVPFGGLKLWKKRSSSLSSSKCRFCEAF